MTTPTAVIIYAFPWDIIEKDRGLLSALLLPRQAAPIYCLAHKMRVVKGYQSNLRFLRLSDTTRDFDSAVLRDLQRSFRVRRRLAGRQRQTRTR